MNYAEIKKNDIANGCGVRVSLFVSGCPHHCKGCFNEVTWDFSYGELFDEGVLMEVIDALAPAYVRGLTLLGGEPMAKENQKGLLPLLRKMKEQYPDKDVWCFTGYIFEKDILEDMYVNWEETKEFLSYIDVLVDGPYVEALKDWSLKFRGSSNQRVISIPESLKSGKTILWEG
ncbi:MAG: anaerobic ribonucleoside-triphosphate reductase activating protein [Lachnospira sp.]|nr:anaerobic ribonucleoside-triphosphate reductase activating protein [Lachnospira sp.]